MCNDRRRVSDTRNLIKKSGRRLLFVTALAALIFCFCVPCFAVETYTDVFDDNNSIAVVRVSREIRYYVDYSSYDSVPMDDYYQSTITEDRISIFSSTEWANIVETAKSGNGSDDYIKIDIVLDVDLVYRHYNDDTSTFPVENVESFSCVQFYAWCNLSPTSHPASWTIGGYYYTVPGSSELKTGTVTDLSPGCLISLYEPCYTDGVFYHNSIQLKNFYATFSYDSSIFSAMQNPVLIFDFSNKYQYTLKTVETTQISETTQIPETTYTPETSEPGFVPGIDTAKPVDTMQGKPDDIDNVLDERYEDFVSNYTDILNGFSWIKYASCFGFIGQFFGAMFQFEPFSDIINAWAIFAVFNILLGGFIVGVSAIVRHHVSRETKENENSDRHSKGGDK